MRCAVLLAASFGAVIAASHADATLVQPNSATASSESSPPDYVIGHTIDGSGLPVNFTPSSAHAAYIQGNHWTSVPQPNNISDGQEFASFFFNAPMTLDAFYMWNHQSTEPPVGVAADANYGVTSFDLILKDGVGMTILSLLNQAALGHIPTAQTYPFAATAGVRQADFIIHTNGATDGPMGTNGRYTGLAEVAFNVVAVPETRLVAPFAALMVLAYAAVRRLGSTGP
jgi:hypothetical protein